jgi:PKD repeat protein
MKTLSYFIVFGLLLSSCCTLLNIEKYCKPDADFNADKTLIIEGESVQFKDESYGDPNYWSWNFQGGNPSGSSEQNPQVLYTNQGIYKVSLNIRNNVGSDTEEKTSFITVNSPTEFETITITPSAILRKCPTHIGGDREFAGHGPDVEASAKLTVVENRHIYVDIYLHEKETRYDWTECVGNWSELIYTAPSSRKIFSILSDMASVTSYRDTDHALDRPPVRGGNLVSKFEIMGDTGGDDVGNCTHDDAYINVYFNPIRVKLEILP